MKGTKPYWYPDTACSIVPYFICGHFPNLVYGLYCAWGKAFSLGGSGLFVCLFVCGGSLTSGQLFQGSFQTAVAREI